MYKNEIETLFYIFGENLKKEIDEQGLTQEAVAEQLKVSRETINRWINGKRIPSLDKFFELCLYLGVGADEISGMDIIQSSFNYTCPSKEKAIQKFLIKRKNKKGDNNETI